MDVQNKCELCGQPMPDGEAMFKYHGFSGPCPAPSEPSKPAETQTAEQFWDSCDALERCRLSGDPFKFAEAYAAHRLQAAEARIKELEEKLADETYMCLQTRTQVESLMPLAQRTAIAEERNKEQTERIVVLKEALRRSLYCDRCFGIARAALSSPSPTEEK